MKNFKNNYSILIHFALIPFLLLSCSAMEGEKPNILNTYGHYFGSGREVHAGIDYHLTTGDPVIACSDGIVLWAVPIDHRYATGYTIGILHKNDDIEFTSHYVHIAKIFVSKGQNVKRGQLLAVVRDDSEKYEHLHFGLMKPGPDRRGDYIGDNYDPNNYWLGGKPQCFDPNENYSAYSQTEITLPVPCKVYRKTLLRQLRPIKGEDKLHYAIRTGDLDSVKKIVPPASSMVDKIDDSGQTPLHNATIFCQYEIIKYQPNPGREYRINFSLSIN